ncbi:MAG: hypothetical protein AAF198_07110 [Pseudomonadota bacterium]
MILYFALGLFLFMISIGFGALIWMKVKGLEWFLGFNDGFWGVAGVAGIIGSVQLMIDLGILR